MKAMLVREYIDFKFYPKSREQIINDIKKLSELELFSLARHIIIDRQYKNLQLILDSGLNVNAVCSYKWSLLMYACQNDNFEAVKVLVKNGVNVNYCNNDGTGLLWASRFGCYDIVKLLIDNGANVNLTDEEFMSPLIYASGNGHIEVVKLLLDNGADVNFENYKGINSLKLAEYYEQEDVIKLLKKYVAK